MAQGGGGAWKVAYADFVTAMMAFFLVMWICAQDQKVRRAVAHYFMDPFNASMVGVDKKPTRTGAVEENLDVGSLPQSQAIALGHGRNPYLTKRPGSTYTKLVSDWLQTDKKASQYWREQARRQRDLARWFKENGPQQESVEKRAVRELAKQLKEEIRHSVPPRGEKLHRALLLEALAEINWTELAEDLIVH